VTGSPHRSPPPLQTDVQVVLLSGRDREDAARLLSLIAGGKPEPQATPPPQAPDESQAGKDRLKACARRLYEERQRRNLHFGSQMFGEPAWEILLILYLEDSGERQAQARLVELSGASRSTGQRWVDHLVRKELAKREEHPTDRRRNFISLSDKGRHLLELYLSETCR
jgi:DNA-binding MarR family transcriptional regulator